MHSEVFAYFGSCTTLYINSGLKLIDELGLYFPCISNEYLLCLFCIKLYSTPILGVKSNHSVVFVCIPILSLKGVTRLSVLTTGLATTEVTENSKSNIDINKISNDPEYCFAALKLIEQLFRDGKIPEYMFHNILKDYADIVDESKFIKGNHNQTKEDTI